MGDLLRTQNSLENQGRLGTERREWGQGGSRSLLRRILRQTGTGEACEGVAQQCTSPSLMPWGRDGIPGWSPIEVVILPFAFGLQVWRELLCPLLIAGSSPCSALQVGATPTTQLPSIP